MLEDMEPIAIEWGVPADKFWEMSYDEIVKQVEANKKRYEVELKNRAMFDYNSAQLNAYAFNSPEKMPKAETIFPFLADNFDPEVENVPVSEQPYIQENDQAILMRALLGVNQHIKKRGEENIN